MIQIVRKLARAGRGNDLVWRHGFNLAPSFGYRFGSRAELDHSSQNIVRDLKTNGIAMANVMDLPGGRETFDQLQKEVEVLMSRAEEPLEYDRANADLGGPIGSKTFNRELLGSQVDFDPDSVFAQFPLQHALLNIANSYFGMYVKLRYYNVWHTIASRSAPRESQLWHFDREDNFILKVFLYLRDVDSGSGPFTYAPGTHRFGAHWGRQPKYFMENNVRRSTDEAMQAVIPKEQWVVGTGDAGTIIFADTRGFHKGGEARTRDRLMYTCMYTSQASDSRRLLKVGDIVSLRSELTKEQFRAISPF
jgi:hypothetical protein